MFLVAKNFPFTNVSTRMDVNIWGEFVVPVGIIICFGPALLAWALMGFGAKKQKDEKH